MMILRYANSSIKRLALGCLCLLALSPSAYAQFSHNFLVIAWSIPQTSWTGYTSTSAPTVSSTIDSDVAGSSLAISLTSTRPAVNSANTWFTVLNGEQSVIPGYGEYVGTMSGPTASYQGYLSPRPINKLKITKMVFLDAPSSIKIYRQNTDLPITTLTVGQSYTLSGSSFMAGGGPASNVFPVIELPDRSFITACHGHYQDDTNLHTWIDQLTLCRDISSDRHTAFTTHLYLDWPNTGTGGLKYYSPAGKRIYVSITDPLKNSNETGVTNETLSGKSDVFIIK